MLVGPLILIFLCIIEIILANLALKDKAEFVMDFYEFFEINSTDHSKNNTK
ncbi:hypothetical protein J6TS2_41340 [Heyndrickxia sporothermodurans]|nr:hypothetical protein J6TS2_41340 [Heyndrickxia sporothermodurans]